MVLQGLDLSLSPTAITPLLLLCRGWWLFLAQVPYVSNQGGVCLDWFKNFVASQPFQSLTLIMSMMNGWRRLWLVYVLYNGHHSVFLRCGWGQSWLCSHPLFTPRLCEFGLVQAIHSISTLPISCWKYNECFFKVEIWVYHPQLSPHPYFWVGGGDDFGSRTLGFKPRWSMIGLIQEFHSISTLPISYYEYDEWLEKVVIGICAL